MFDSRFVFQPWQSEEEGSWLREYPVTLMQFFRYLYHNVPDLAPMWHSAEFLCALAASVFPFNIRPYSEMVSLNLVTDMTPDRCRSERNRQLLLVTTKENFILHKSLVSNPLFTKREKFLYQGRDNGPNFGFKGKRNLITSPIPRIDFLQQLASDVLTLSSGALKS